MSCFDVKILDPNINTIEIETCIGDQPASIDILTYDNTSLLEVSHCVALLPSEINDLITVKDILGGSGILVTSNNRIFTISLTDHTINASGVVDLLETVQDIIGESGLLAGNNISINYNDNTGYTTISTTGLQPSGNYALANHSHLSADITNFNSSVSGLLPVKNISAGSGIGISSISGDYTISVTGAFGLTSEQVDDRVSQLLVGGSYTNLNYDDNNNILTINVTGLQPSGNYSIIGHTHSTSDIIDFNSSVSGLLPTIKNYANNRVLTSDGTITGINAENNLTFDNLFLEINCVCPSGNAGIKVIGDDKPASIFIQAHSDDVLDKIPRLIFRKTGGSYTSPTVPISSATLFSIRGDSIDSSGNYEVLSRIRSQVSSPASGSQHSSTVMKFEVSSGSGTLDKSLQLFSDGSLVNSGSFSATTGNFTQVLVNSIPVSISGHNHTSNDISDFNTSVSGLLPVKNISAGNGIGITNTSGDYTISVTGTFGLTGEEVDDRVSNLLVAGNYISLNYNDNSNILTISSTGLQPSGNYSTVGHSHTSNDITDFNSSVSGLLPITQIGGSSGIVVSNTGSIYDISTSGLAFTSGANFDTLLVTGVPVSISGHQHSYTDITNFSSGVQDSFNTLLVAGAFINLNYDPIGDALTISATGLQPSGNYANSIHSHGNISSSGTIGSTSGLLITTTSNGLLTTSSGITSSYITNFNSSVSGLLPSVSGSGYIYSSFNNNIYTISASGLQPSGNYSVVGHTHTSSQITDFNTSVSGLLPVKDIVAGSGISIVSSTGVYTINADVSGLFLETIQDNLATSFLIAGTGVQLSYNDSANTLTLNNLHTEINVLSTEPQGFVNRTDSIISFNDATRTFTIQPSGSSYDVYIKGVKVTKTSSESIVVPTGTALNYIHFDTDTGLLSNKTTFFNFNTDVPIAYVHWNNSTGQSTFFAEERHGIRMDSSTHLWINNTFGMQYINGLSIGGYTLLGNGSSNTHAQINLSDGTLYQEDIIINVADGNDGIEFTQQLTPIAYIPVYYHSGSAGQWVKDVSTSFPVKYNSTRALYNLYSGGTWTTTNVPNNRYFAMWIVATNDRNDPILAIMGQREDSSLISAENNNIWNDLNLTNLPANEIRPIYRLIFVTNDTFTNTPKSSLQSILDLRTTALSTTVGVSQNDHGNLFGLGDDDHPQYVHINENRTISANHTFTNGLTITGGLLSAQSGDFSSLSVNSTGVSLNGHTHTSSNISDFNTSVSGLLPSVTGTGYVNTTFNNNIYSISVTGLQPSGNYANATHTHTSSEITDFNSSVSGLLPTVANSGDNRLLTSTGTSTGINAESNLTFDGSVLNIDGNLVFDSFTESVVSIGNSSTSQTLSISSGTVQTCTLTGNCTFTMPSAVAGKSFTLFLNTGVGNYTASFSSVLWNDSSPPTITTTANKVDILSFISDGSYWYGSYSQNYG